MSLLACAVMKYSYIVVFSKLVIETEVPFPCKQALALFDPVLWKRSSSSSSESQVGSEFNCLFVVEEKVKKSA